MEDMNPKKLTEPIVSMLFAPHATETDPRQLFLLTQSGKLYIVNSHDGLWDTTLDAFEADIRDHTEM